jgi:4-aminobutyrate---pyruvate transaminase
VTLACASVSGLPQVHRDFGLPLEDTLRTECPHHYRHGLPGETEAAFGARLARRSWSA